MLSNMRWKVAAVAIVLSLSVFVCLRPVLAPAPQPDWETMLQRFQRMAPPPVPTGPFRERSRRCPPPEVAPSCSLPAGAYLLTSPAPAR